MTLREIMTQALEERRLAYKVLDHNFQACGGGKFDYRPYLPTEDEPGPWLPEIQNPVLHRRGYHVTYCPYMWPGNVIFLVELPYPSTRPDTTSYRGLRLMRGYDRSVILRIFELDDTYSEVWQTLRFLRQIRVDDCVDIRLWACLRYPCLAGLDFSYADLHNANFQNADLQGANLIGANLQNVDFEGANLQGSNLREADLRGADFDAACLQGANLVGAILQDANLWRASLQEADLRMADLRRTNLPEANLRSADLSLACLRGADLRDACLNGANLSGAIMYGTNLFRADLRDANLEDIDLRETNLQGADLRGARRNDGNSNIQGWYVANGRLTK